MRFVRKYSPKTYDRKEILRRIMNFVAECKVEGDYLEFGVYKGSTFVEAVKMAKAKRLTSMKFFAFDSFQGLPTPEGVDKNFGQFYGGQVSNSLVGFRKVLSSNKINLDEVEVVSCWFKDTLNKENEELLNLKSAAVIWIDCDLYGSTHTCLDFITDLVVDGTIIVLDDYFFYKGRPDMGERNAFAEWLKNNPNFSATEFHKYSWHGNSFIIHRSDGSLVKDI